MDVALDDNLDVVAQERDGDGDGDVRMLSDSERTAAEDAAALDAVGGGTVTEVRTSDDPGKAYEVDVRDSDNVEWDVELDANLEVLRKNRDQ